MPRGPVQVQADQDKLLDEGPVTGSQKSGKVEFAIHIMYGGQVHIDATMVALGAAKGLGPEPDLHYRITAGLVKVKD